MTITTDNFGNYYLGNFVAGYSFTTADLLSLMRTALGSDDRANLNGTTSFKIDWRPNIVEETLTGVIVIPSSNTVTTTLTANSRMSFGYPAFVNSTPFVSAFLTGGGHSLGQTFPVSIVNSPFWAIANSTSVSFYVQDSAKYFFSQGVLLNSPLPFPQNLYSISIYNARINSKVSTDFIKSVHTFTNKANYAHTKASDSTATQSEVELYLRDFDTDIPYGYIPNVFKWKVDGDEVAPVVGDVVRLNMSAATGNYVGQGTIFTKVVGRLGSTNNADGAGDYLLMKVAGL